MVPITAIPIKAFAELETWQLQNEPLSSRRCSKLSFCFFFQRNRETTRHVSFFRDIWDVEVYDPRKYAPCFEITTTLSWKVNKSVHVIGMWCLECREALKCPKIYLFHPVLLGWYRMAPKTPLPDIIGECLHSLMSAVRLYFVKGGIFFCWRIKFSNTRWVWIGLLRVAEQWLREFCRRLHQQLRILLLFLRGEAFYENYWHRCFSTLLIWFRN